MMSDRIVNATSHHYFLVLQAESGAKIVKRKHRAGIRDGSPVVAGCRPGGPWLRIQWPDDLTDEEILELLRITSNEAEDNEA